jgi:electron transfer flavoprotein alpha subunit
MDAEAQQGEVWVFGDYRDYLKNRVTLELIAKARDLAEDLGTRCGAVILGHGMESYIMEYIAHGAQVVYVMDAPNLARFQATIYARALCELADRFRPTVLLVGGTDFGREFAPRVAKRLATGLSADCVALEIDPADKVLVQTTPAFGGHLLAEVVTPIRRPQMATVRPGTFKEIPHRYDAQAPVVYVEPIDSNGDDEMELLSVERLRSAEEELETVAVVVAGGQGMGSAEGFQTLYRLAELLGGQVGGTRPAVLQGWLPEDRMIGQTGHTIRPKVLITCGTSGALQYTASLQGAEYIIAVNKDPNAPIFRSADLGIVGDVREILPRLIRALEGHGNGVEVEHD